MRNRQFFFGVVLTGSMLVIAQAADQELLPPWPYDKNLREFKRQ